MLGTFNIQKTIQAAATLMKVSPFQCMSRMRLLKFLYIADRESLKEAGRPITTDVVVAMRKGPVLSQTYDLIKGNDWGSPAWDKHFSNVGFVVHLTSDPGVDQLSKFELEKLHNVSSRFQDADDEDVAEYTHQFPEWLKNRPEGNGQKNIPLDDLLEAIGMLPHKDELVSDARSLKSVDAILDSVRR
jgi:uncharacterized phage-associated protein